MSALEEITFSGNGTFSSAFGASNTSLKTIDLQGGTFSSDISSLNKGVTFSTTVGDTHTALAIKNVLEGSETGTLSNCKAYLAASGCFNDYDPDFKYKFTVNNTQANTVTLTISGGTTTPTANVGDETVTLSAREYRRDDWRLRF